MGMRKVSGGTAREALRDPQVRLDKNGMWRKPRPTSQTGRVGRANTRPTFRQTACFDQRAEQR